MANTITTAVKKSDSMSQQLHGQLSQFYRNFLKEHREILNGHGLPARATLFGQPHDAVILVDTASIIVIACKGTATDTSSTEHYIDLSSKGEVEVPMLMRSAARDFGWNDMIPLVFSRILLDKSEVEQKKEYHQISEAMVENIQRRRKVADELGITEAFEYLANAKARFDTGGATGFSDCKANCRNAIKSLMIGLAKTEDINLAMKQLNKEGLLGKREAEVVEAISNLISKLHGLASKKGTHPPLADEDDALFTLKLTNSAVEYIVTLVSKAKGL